MALIGSTALRIDTPDSDLDVVVYTCTLADPLRWQKLLGGELRFSASKMMSLENIFFFFFLNLLGVIILTNYVICVRFFLG